MIFVTNYDVGKGRHYNLSGYDYNSYEIQRLVKLFDVDFVFSKEKFTEVSLESLVLNHMIMV